jgi:hypothetical protein
MSTALRRTIAISAVALGFAACSTLTAITQEWTSPAYAGGPMKNLLVIGTRVDPAQRRTLEDGFASSLNAHGVRATPSYTVFPDGLPNKDQAADVMQKSGFDGVLLSVVRLEPGHEYRPRARESGADPAAFAGAAGTERRGSASSLRSRAVSVKLPRGIEHATSPDTTIERES